MYFLLVCFVLYGLSFFCLFVCFVFFFAVLFLFVCLFVNCCFCLFIVGTSVFLHVCMKPACLYEACMFV